MKRTIDVTSIILHKTMSFCPAKKQYHSYHEWVNGLIRTRCDFLNTTVHKCRKKQQIYACVNNLKSGIFLYILYISNLILQIFCLTCSCIIFDLIYCNYYWCNLDLLCSLSRNLQMTSNV